MRANNDLISRAAYNHVGGRIDCNDIARFSAEDYERLERYLRVGSQMQWRDGSIPPTVEGETVLVLFSGNHRGIEFRYACEQAAYYRDEGWILEHYPEFANARISHWMPLPEMPEAIERELHEG